MLFADARTQFPVTSNMVYLDAALQTPLCTAVRAGLESFYDQSMMRGGPKRDWLAHIEAVRAQLATFLNVAVDTVAFTKNTSEGANICARGLEWNPGDNVVMLSDEHPNSMLAWRARERDGLNVRLVPNEQGWADAQTFAPHIDDRTRAIIVSHILYHSGALVDVKSIVEMASASGLPVVVDIMQSVGVLPLDLKELGATVVISGSHKGLLTPHGLGFVHTRAGNDVLRPSGAALASVSDSTAMGDELAFHRDARRFETGNYNLPGLHALGGALDLLSSWGPGAVARHARELGDGLIAEMGTLGVRLVSPSDKNRRAPHIYVFDLDGARWAQYLESRNIRVSAVPGGLRVSLGAYNSEQDVDRLVDAVSDGLRTEPQLR